jgi:molybdopterin/thiamine biosynthesis adenylyltransferase
MKKLKNIGIAGAGGIGSNLVAMLFDYGFNRKQFDYSSVNVDVYDDDVVDTKNLLHQNFKIEDIGKTKVKVLEDKFVINGIESFMTEKQFKKYDVIFSCVDSMEFRKALYEYSFNAGDKSPFWIDGRCTSRQGALFTSQQTEEVLRKYITDSSDRGGCLYEYEKEQNISHALPIVVAGMMLQAFLNWFRGEKTDKKVFLV